MKIHIRSACIFLLLFITHVIVRADYDDIRTKAERKFYAARNYPALSLPNQAWVCDVVVVGRVTNILKESGKTFADGFADIVVDSYWRGDLGTNFLKVPMNFNHQPPVTNTPVVFFLTQYSRLSKTHDFPPITSGHAPRVNMDIFRANIAQDGLWLYLNSKQSWFHVDEKNTDITAFASNLVFAVNSNNTNAFYETVRDGSSGYEWFPPNQDEWRIYFDSMSALVYPDFYFSTNFIFQTICEDPDFPEKVLTRYQFDGYLNTTYGTKFGFELGTKIVE